MNELQAALVAVGTWLHAHGYVFVTPTPETHRRVLARPAPVEPSLRDVFGWNRPVRLEALPATVLSLAGAAELWERPDDGGRVKSRFRFSTLELGERWIFAHSAYPTTDTQAVFFGPDTYRFVAAARRSLRPVRRLVDVGCGTGAGGLALADRVDEVVLADVNPQALALAEVNVALARAVGTLPAQTKVSLCESDVLRGVAGDVDAVIANPPYLVDGGGGDGARLYRDGGGTLGTELGARVVEEALARGAEGGQVLLYTGVPIIGGCNVLEERLRPLLNERGARWAWEELDPDVFGEELEGAAYAETERLAAVSLTVTLGAPARPPRASPSS